MFNSPILDVTIGLVFVFLLYSLLATSINEAISTGFALRARMLRKSISNHMLSNTPQDNKFISFLKGILLFIQAIFYRPKIEGNKKNIGLQFYDHPIIKNYGSSRFFRDPSYLNASNFSVILVDVLKEDFNNKLPEIALLKNIPNFSLEQKMEILDAGSDLEKVKELIAYYAWYYAKNTETDIYNELQQIPRGLDKETHCILQIFLKNSNYDLDVFKKSIEGWYNDTMDRVSGWYKRHMQFLLFCIGIAIAVVFNVDTIQIANKLSTDKTAREQIVQLAIKASEGYKDDPRIIKARQNNNDSVTENKLMDEYQAHLDEARKMVDSNIREANDILALGWGRYGRDDSSFLQKLKNKTWIGLWYIDEGESILDSVKKSIPPAGQIRTGDADSVVFKKDSILLHAFYEYEYKNYPVHVKTAYVWHVITTQKKKLVGFLLTAFAICLGAPFWFDLLNKLVKIRAAGKKENGGSGSSVSPATAPQPVSVNVNTQKPGEEEAVG